jgi:NAD(P)-dependent dehydrogenase (short-subunit alcohol dehydrogenase family)
MKKIALVSGANRGLGLALCKQLLNESYQVHALCRQSSIELSKLDLTIHENVDLSKIEAIADFARRLKIEKLDLLVNNAAIGHEDSIDNMDYAGLKKQFETNAIGPLALSLNLVPFMHAGSIIAMITSRMGSIGDNKSGGSYAYRMSKASLNCLGKNLAIDLKERGISVALLSPGLVDTDMLRDLGVTTGADAQEVAKKLCSILKNVTLANSGSFWHIDGQISPW